MTLYLDRLRIMRGFTQTAPVPVCTCDERRGPLGGVCGACGDAIPAPGEVPYAIGA